MIKNETIAQYYICERLHIFRFFRLKGWDRNMCTELTQDVFVILLRDRRKIKNIKTYCWGTAWKVRHARMKHLGVRYKHRGDPCHEEASRGLIYTEDKLIEACDARARGEEGWR